MATYPRAALVVVRVVAACLVLVPRGLAFGGDRVDEDGAVSEEHGVLAVLEELFEGQQVGLLLGLGDLVGEGLLAVAALLLLLVGPVQQDRDERA